MKNLKLLPFVLLGLYFTITYFFSNLLLEIKLVFAAVIVIVSTLIFRNQLKMGLISKKQRYLFAIFTMVSVAIALFFLFQETTF